MSLSVEIRHRAGAFTLDAAFQAPSGVTALFGRSGAGKTTVVNAVAGLIRPEAGRITLGTRVLWDASAGIWVPPHRRRIGYVFQQARLFPHLSVAQNLSYGSWFARRQGRAPAAKLAQVVEMLGIGPLLARRPATLSGGEAQRVAIGRALLAAPELLLLDEPLAALDDARKAEILPYLERLRDETQVPVLYVSHAVSEIARLANTVVALEQGRVVRAGPAEALLADPQVVPTLGVREAGAVLTGRVRAHHEDGLTELSLRGGPLLVPGVTGAPGDHVRVRVHAHDVIIARARPEGLSALNILPATVRQVHQGAGPGVAVQLDLGGDLLLARITRRSAEALALAPGVTCHAILKSVSVGPADLGQGAGPGEPDPAG